MTVNEICFAVRERLETENTGYIPGVERPLLKISNRYQGLWLEHLYDAILYAKMDGSKLYLAENAVYEFVAHQRKNGQFPMAITVTGVGYTHIQECVSFGKLVLMIYEMNGDRDFLATAYDALVKWVAWLRSARMTTGRGLVEQFVGYDTGHDNSLRNVGMGCQGRYQKTKEQSYDADVLPPDDGVMPILAVDMNCNFYGNHMALARMADILGYDSAKEWRVQAKAIKKRLFEECFSEKDCFFYDVDKNGNRRKYLSISITNVFSEHLLTQEEFDVIYDKHMKNPDEFYTEYPFPSIAKSDPSFKQNKSGNSWGFYSQALTMLRCTRWMDFYGKSKDFDEILEKWIRKWTFGNDIMFGQELHPLTGKTSDCSEWYSSCMLIYLYSVKRLKLNE